MSKEKIDCLEDNQQIQNIMRKQKDINQKIDTVQIVLLRQI